MNIIFIIIGLVVAITIHEFCHAYVADRLGDPTPRAQGRVTLNPLAHLDIMGTLMMIFFHFGWGKPVIVNSQYFRAPLRDAAIVSLAGPLSNFVIAFVLSIFLSATHMDLPFFVFEILDTIVNINIVLGVFNLLPFPPFDGSKILGLFIPKKWERTYERYLERGTVYVILFVLFDYIVVAPILGISVIQFLISVVSAFIKGVFVLGG